MQSLRLEPMSVTTPPLSPIDFRRPIFTPSSRMSERLPHCEMSQSAERISSPTVVPCRIIMVAPSYPSGGRLPNASSGEEYNKSGSLLEPTGHLIDHPWCVFEQQTTVVTRRLDSVTAELKLNRIDFIWMDVQGAEKLVLAGANAGSNPVSIHRIPQPTPLP